MKAFSKKPITAVNQYTRASSPEGKYNIVLSGVWVGALTVLRRFKDIKAMGVHSGAANAAALTHAAAGEEFVVSALLGMYVSNDTDGSFGLITANTSTTITATLAGGTDNDWDVGDTFSLWYAATTYSANIDPQAEETEPGVDLVVLATSWSSGVAMVRISQ